ncbi:MAG: M28 family peptidase, partial [Pyrinomonadaceae bacterium]
MKRNVFALLLLAAFAVQPAATARAQAVRITPAERKIAEGVTAAQLRDYLYFVASDEMEGRDTPSRGLDTTAKFIAMNLSRWGFKPAGDDGTYFQKIALNRELADPETTTLRIGGKAMTFGDDFVRARGSGTAEGTMVFGGDGWMVKSKGIDAFKGVDVRGKVVVLYGTQYNPATLISSPTGVTSADIAGTKGVDWADPITYAAQKGAAGVLIVAPPQFQSDWAQVRTTYAGGRLYPEKLRPQAGAPIPPVMFVTQQAADTIFAGESGDKTSPAAFAINKTASIAAATKPDTVWTQNVIAIWEGRDPVLKSEMVAIGAHYDHVGINPNAKGDDKIYNGADDDGSGTVSVLSIAEALARAPARPKRSVLFVWHCGEEKGLWGSEYFNKFPTVNIKNVVAQLNIDMIGRSKKTDDTNPKNKDLS